MSAKHIHQFITDPITKPSKKQLIFWLCLSLTFAALYGFLGLRKAFGSEFVVQDDARQYVFWLQRLVDRELLPNDLIADYYQSVSPPGYVAIYWLMAKFGIHPLLFSKLLPTLVGLVTTIYTFGVCMQILPLPVAAFLSTWLLNQSLWMKDDLVSATPRTFLYPLFAAFLYYLLRRSYLPCLVTIALQGLIYPPVALISLIVLFLRLWDWKKQIHLYKERKYYVFCALAVGVTLLSILPNVLSAAKYGPTITGSVAKTLPEFLPKGRASFFHTNPLAFWLMGKDSGLLPWLKPQAILVGFSLPILMRYQSRFPLIKQCNNNFRILLEIVLASLVMFIVAHGLLFKLYCPSRYTEHTLRIVLAIAGGLVLTATLDAVLRTLIAKDRGNNWKLWLTGAIAAALLIHPNLLNNFPTTAYKIGRATELYKFFQAQPKDILIASLSPEANNIPTFSKRSILVSAEYSLPYHTKYYAQIRQRAIDLINAHYSLHLTEVQNFIQKYGVDFWLLNSWALTTRYITINPWLMQYQPEANQAIARLKQGNSPALAKVMDRCSVLQAEDLYVLSAECILRSPANQ